IWSEGFADYERRTGLGDATGPASRSQHSAGFLVGADHTMRNGDADILVGLLGGASNTQQAFQRASNQQLLTNYVANFTPEQLDPGSLGYPGPFSFSYPFPTAHSINADEQQRLTGPSLGLTSSFFRGGFFSDAVVKADFLTLNQTSTVSDTFDRSLRNTPP